MLRKAPLIVAVALLGGFLLGKAGAAPVTHAVRISDSGYSPQSITITSGDTISWQNIGTRSHTSTSDSGVWDSGPIAPGGTYQRLFNEAYGIFRYHDNSDGFAGEVIVQVTAPSPTPTPTSGPTPTPTAGPTPTPTPTPTATATPSPTPTPTGTGGPTETPGNLCYPEGEISIHIPVLQLYVWIDGIWQETNRYFGLQRTEFVCEDGRRLPPDTKVLGVGA